MKKEYGFGSGSVVRYDVILKNGEIIKNKGKACFSSLNEINNSEIKEIIIYDLDFIYTIEYKNLYLQYVIDMLKLDANFDNECFRFKTFNCKYKNLLVCSIIRLLWERFGNIYPSIEMDDKFFKPLLINGKSKYRNKLKRFCDFYSKIQVNSYFHDGHSWNPKKTKIKTTEDFISKNSLSYVNSFFTT